MNDDPVASPETPMDAGEIRSKAVAGVVSVGVRNLLVRVAGLVGTILLARLLDPRDFGLLALGLTFKLLGSLLASAGLGAELMRRDIPPTKAELRSVLAFQLLSTLVIVLIVGAIGLLTGGAMAIAAVMTLSLPIAVLNTPARTLLGRSLDWNLLARAEVTATLAFNAVAIGLVVLGAGVWGVAIASIIEAAVTTVILTVSGPVGLMKPVFSLKLIKPILRFGIAYQSVALLETGRDQALNVLIAAVGGVAVLGIWTVAFRIFLAISLLLEALWRVSFPAMARLLAVGGQAKQMIESTLKLNALAFGALVVAVGGTAPAQVPALFGDSWTDAVNVLPWGAAALLVSAPISAAGMSFIQARGEGGQMVRVVVIQAVVWIGAAAVLVPFVGAEGAGVAMFVSAIAYALTMGRILGRHEDVRLFGIVLLPALAAVTAGAVSWEVALRIHPSGLGFAASLLVGQVLYLAAMLAVRRDDSLMLLRLVQGGAAAAFPTLGRLAPRFTGRV